jgi:AcrR family transcriptional regulator
MPPRGYPFSSPAAEQVTGHLDAHTERRDNRNRDSSYIIRNYGSVCQGDSARSAANRGTPRRVTLKPSGGRPARSNPSSEKQEPGDARKPTARELRVDAQRNLSRLLDSAETVFAARGVSVPIDEIAAHAGIGIGTVYRRFPTKEALLQAIMQRRFRLMIDEARSLATSEDPGGSFFAFFRKLIDEGRTKHDLLSALSTAGIDIKGALAEDTREVRNAVGVLLSRAPRAGAVRADVEVVEVLALLTGMLGAAESVDVRSIERIAAIVCDGLRPAGSDRTT